MRYKMLALDIDETVTTEGAVEVSPRVYEALHKASEKLTITFVTARAINRFTQFLENLNLPQTYHVVENGAKILDPQMNLVYDLSIPHDEVQSILDVAEPYVISYGFLSDEHWREDPTTIDPVSTITGISFTCVSEEYASLLEQGLRQLPHEYAFYIGHHWSNPDEWKGILIFHKDATKGNGMRYIQAKLGITKEETIAVGDGATDISMFEAAGLKVAVKGGVQSLLDEADITIPPASADGIVEFIEKYILKD